MSHQRMRILVVDDDLTARLLMRAALEKSGYEVCLAENGKDALCQIRLQSFDLVMLDVEMPGLNGYQVCAQLRQEMGNELPIIMVTGMDDHESIEQAFASGATDFIAKPISWGLIGHRVKYLLRAYRVLQDLHASNARNLAILNAIPDLLFEMDLDGRYLDFHSPHSDQLAVPPTQLLGKTVTEVLPPEAAATCLSALREAHEQGRSIGKQFELPLPQGTCWFELSVSIKKGNSAQKPHFIIIVARYHLAERGREQDSPSGLFRPLDRSSQPTFLFRSAGTRDSACQLPKQQIGHLVSGSGRFQERQ